EEDKIDLAKEILAMAEKKSVDFLLPVDVKIADRFDNDAKTDFVAADKIPTGYMGLDIGPKTIKLFSRKIETAGTIVWNGPLGVFEMPNFSQGTKKIAEAIAIATEQGAISVIGGGDSAAAVSQFGMDERFTHISTGGGASLEFLEGKELPGIAALTEV
ncbi:MAG TPA: phosphoglycerate kinase, partial [Calditrichaeota bacterium]|nr:phosphoglycerate kinase [Calditrichota bacterium]